MGNAFKSHKKKIRKTKNVTNKHLNILDHYNCKKPEMYMYYVCTYTEDNSKPGLLLKCLDYYLTTTRSTLLRFLQHSDPQRVQGF